MMETTGKLIVAAVMAAASIVTLPVHAQGFIGGLADQVVPKAKRSYFCATSMALFGPRPAAPAGSPCATPFGLGLIVVQEASEPEKSEFGISGRRGCVVLPSVDVSDLFKR